MNCGTVITAVGVIVVYTIVAALAARFASPKWHPDRGAGLERSDDR